MILVYTSVRNSTNHSESTCHNTQKIFFVLKTIIYTIFSVEALRKDVVFNCLLCPDGATPQLLHDVRGTMMFLGHSIFDISIRPMAIVRVIIPFKHQESANHVKKQLKDLSLTVQGTVKPVFVSRKINQDLKVEEKKPQTVNQQRVVYRFQCDLCDAGYVGYTRGHLNVGVDAYKQRSSSIYKHYP